MAERFRLGPALQACCIRALPHPPGYRFHRKKVKTGSHCKFEKARYAPMPIHEFNSGLPKEWKERPWSLHANILAHLRAVVASLSRFLTSLHQPALNGLPHLSFSASSFSAQPRLSMATESWYVSLLKAKEFMASIFCQSVSLLPRILSVMRSTSSCKEDRGSP